MIHVKTNTVVRRCPNKLINEKSARERLEWVNLWIDQANEENVKKRILLVGDSTSRVIRRTMSEALGDVPVDLFATSAALRDVIYWDQLDAFFKNNQYKYDFIFVQVGNHSRINEDGNGPFTEYDYTRFHDDYTILIEYLQNYCKHIILEPCYLMVVPRKDGWFKDKVRKVIHKYLKVKFSQQPNIEANAVSQKKNDIMKMVAKELSMPWCDINAYLDSTYFIRRDNIHYEYMASLPICNYLINFARKTFKDEEI